MKIDNVNCTKLLEEIVSFFSETELKELARKTGFVQRERKITGKNFCLS
jgi:hypothetical protein